MQTIQQLLASKPDNGDRQPVQYIGTVEAYDKWAEVYDSDGNFLQRLDTLEMRTLLPRFLNRVYARFSAQAARPDNKITLLDLGCGTGRNTIQLFDALSQASSQPGNPSTSAVEIVGLDASPGMLDVARTALQQATAASDSPSPRPHVSLGILDLLNPGTSRTQLPASLRDYGAAGVLSTLVLEHIPARAFFEAAAGLMRAGAYLLVTNMHADMGTRSQAGFTDPQSGVKIRPTSYCHSIQDVLAAADAAGLEVEDIVGGEGEGGVLVKAVDEPLAKALGVRAEKWIGVEVWFGVCFRKREEMK